MNAENDCRERIQRISFPPKPALVAIAPPTTTMEEMEEAAPVNQSRHSTWLGWALDHLSRLLGNAPTEPSRPPQPPTTTPPPPLMEELEEEILLRFPPHEPALLVRASLVCKRWRRLVSSPGFRRRFRELHRAPPMLGFLCNIADDSEDGSKAGFIATAAFCTPDADLGDFRPLDARHGRVLLQSSEDALVVWDPIAKDALQLPLPDLRWYYSWTAAILCAAGNTCDHLDCHRGSFLVVFMGSGRSGKAFICTYSSNAGTWSEPISTEPISTELPVDMVVLMPSVLVGNALYFGFPISKLLLKYDLESHEVSVIGVPQTFFIWRHVVLDGGLALATLQEWKLCLWRKTGPEVDAGWTQYRAIELETLLPADAFTWVNVIGFADGTDVVFLRAGFMVFTIDLKTYEVKKVSSGKNIYSAIPYMSFCTPGLYAEDDKDMSVDGANTMLRIDKETLATQITTQVNHLLLQDAADQDGKNP